MSRDNLLVMTHRRPRPRGLSIQFIQTLSQPPQLSKTLLQPQINLPSSTQPQLQEYNSSSIQSSKFNMSMASIYLTKYTSCG